MACDAGPQAVPSATAYAAGVLTLLHDYVSPASAVAVWRLQRLADAGMAIAFEGFVALEFGAARRVTRDVAVATERCAEQAAAMGLRLRLPARLPPTMQAHQVAALAEAGNLGASWREVCYRAVWERALDIDDRDVLARLAREAGLDPATVAAALEDPGAPRALRQRMGRRRSQGAGGVPLLDAGGTLVPADLPDADVRALAAL